MPNPFSSGSVLVASVATLAFTSACAVTGPPAHPETTVSRVPGARVSVETNNHIEMERVSHESSTCPQGYSPGAPQCMVTHYTELEPVKHYEADAIYGGRKLTLADFASLTDPDYQNRLDDMDRLSDHCNKVRPAGTTSVVVMGAGLAAVLVGGTIAAVAESKSAPAGERKPPTDPTGNYVVLGGAAGFGAGLTGALVSYFALGGRECGKSRDMYAALPSDKETHVYTREQADKMKADADAFNRGVVPSRPAPGRGPRASARTGD